MAVVCRTGAVPDRRHGRVVRGTRPSPTASSRQSSSPTSSAQRRGRPNSETGRWRELLERHHRLIRRELVRFRGAELDVAGDGFFARFDGPARAVRCASAIVDGVRELGLELRAGLHTGECELLDGKVGGIAVHIGARVATGGTTGRGARLEHRQGPRRRARGSASASTGPADAERRERRLAPVCRRSGSGMIRRAQSGDVEEIASLYERSFATLDFLPVLHTLDEHRRGSRAAGGARGLGVGRGRRPRLHRAHRERADVPLSRRRVDRPRHRLGAARPREDAPPRRLHALDVPAERRARHFYERRGSCRSSSRTARGTRRRLPTCATGGRPPASGRPVALDGAASERGELARLGPAGAARGRVRVLRGARCGRRCSIRCCPPARRRSSSPISIATSSGSAFRSRSSSPPPGTSAARRSCASATGPTTGCRRASRSIPSRARRRSSWRTSSGRTARSWWRRSSSATATADSRSSRRPRSQDRAALDRSLRAIAELPVELVLVSHGEPVLEDGRAAIELALRERAFL